jgi:ATP-binding cassette subfamily F protein uup
MASPPLLTLTNAAVGLGRQKLFEGVSLTVGRGDRVCLVGRNGSGKSTLLKALAGTLELDAGERQAKAGATTAYLPQDPAPGPHQTARELVLGGLPADLDPARADSVAEMALSDFGLVPDVPLQTLSGGELRKAALARALAGGPEILLLDEPTNHLDIEAIERLEQRLLAFRGGLVLVSHDRRFLEALSRTTWWLDRGSVRVLNDGFASFDAWSAAVLDEEATELRRLDKTLQAESQWLRYGVTARRKRNQGRLRRLTELRAERARRVPPAGRARIEAATDPRGGTLVIEARQVDKAFGDRRLIRDFSTRILKGDRIGIVGPNGAGKTTLLRLLTGQLAPDRGEIRLGTNLSISYVDQRRGTLDPDQTPWQLLCPDGGDRIEVRGSSRHVVGYLRDFLFQDEQARTPIRVLSGGERNRLLLAQQLARPANLLVLDEPTNDLDMETLELLQEVLADFAGTVLLVSHDRDFLDRLVTSVIAFEGDGRLQEYAGGYSDMLRQRSPPVAEAVPVRPPPVRPPKAAPAGPKRPARELERVVARIEALETAIGELETRLGDPDLFHRDPAVFASTTADLEAKRAELCAAEDRWAELEALIEARD